MYMYLIKVKLFYETLYTTNDCKLINVDMKSVISDYKFSKLDIQT